VLEDVAEDVVDAVFAADPADLVLTANPTDAFLFYWQDALDSDFVRRCLDAAVVPHSAGVETEAVEAGPVGPFEGAGTVVPV